LPQNGVATVQATMNRHTPLHHEGWMDGKWLENNFLLGFNSLANHGGQLLLLNSCFVMPSWFQHHNTFAHYHGCGWNHCLLNFVIAMFVHFNHVSS